MPATFKQKQAFDKLVENGGNVSKTMREVGYSAQTAKTPQKLTESEGWKELCEAHGLTDDFLVDALVEDIENKPQNRKAELELAFKIKGKMTEKIDITAKGILIMPNELIQKNESTQSSE